MYREIYN